jgi:hypothetical protein
LRGRALKTLASPVALHVTHAPRWDGSVYLFFHALISYVTDLAARTRGRDTSAAGRQFDLLYDLVSHLYRGTFAKGTEPARGGTDPDPGGVAALADFYDRFQEVIVHHIKSNAVSFTVAEPR